MVVLLSGISKRWVQPVAYTVAYASASFSHLHNLLMSLLKQLQEIGISIKALICDQGASNVSLSRQLGVSVGKPFFTIDGNHIFFIFDVPHLVKTTWNNLQMHKLHIGQEVVDWAHVTKLYHSTHELRLRLAPKLTERHIYQKPFSNMKVKRATQVLSASVSIAITTLVYVKELPDSALATANFCDRMDMLFDALNSSSPKKNAQKMRYAIIKGKSEVLDFLEAAAPWIATWNFEGRRQPHTITGWQVTIKAILMLWEELSNKYNFRFLHTRRLQKDPLENMFGSIRQRQGCNMNPTVPHFISGLKHIMIQRIMKLSDKGNVEEDRCVLLQELSPFSFHKPSLADHVQPPCSDDFPPLEDISLLASLNQPHAVDDAASYYVARFLIKKFLEKCPENCHCLAFLKDDQNDLRQEHQYFMMLKAYHVPGKLFGNLTVPSAGAFEMFQEMESAFLSIVESVVHCHGICSILSAKLSSTNFLLCSLDCHARFLKMYCRMRLCWHVRFVNHNLDNVRFQSSVSGLQLDKFNS